MPGVIGGILAAAELASAIAKMGEAFPGPPAGITDKYRWLTVTVFNQTQYEIVYLGNAYFDSGRFWAAPTNIEPFSSMTLSGCNTDGSFFTGVSGGAAFQLQMPQQGGGSQTLEIDIGFTNPDMGAIKTSVLLNAGPEAAYDAATSSSSNVTSSTFSGVDDKGNPTTIQFFITASPGQEASVTITEEIVSSGN